MFFPFIHKFQTQIFTIIVYVSWALYIAIALGLSVKAPQYLNELQYYVKYYISFFLLFRFNPFRRVKFTELDSKIAFSAGLFLLATTAVNGVIHKAVGTSASLWQNYLEEIRQVISGI